MENCLNSEILDEILAQGGQYYLSSEDFRQCRYQVISVF